MSKMQSPSTTFERGFLERLDGRTSVAQLLRDQWQRMAGDLGGADSLSLAQEMLIERALHLHYWLRRQDELLYTDASEFDAGKYSAATNTLQGVLAKLGLQRVPRDVPNLADFLQRRKDATA